MIKKITQPKLTLQTLKETIQTRSYVSLRMQTTPISLPQQLRQRLVMVTRRVTKKKQMYQEEQKTRLNTEYYQIKLKKTMTRTPQETQRTFVSIREFRITRITQIPHESQKCLTQQLCLLTIIKKQHTIYIFTYQKKIEKLKEENTKQIELEKQKIIFHTTRILTKKQKIEPRIRYPLIYETKTHVKQYKI